MKADKMKICHIAIVAALILFLISGCITQASPNPIEMMTNTPTQQPASATLTPVSTNISKELVEQIKKLVADYDTLVQQEKKTGAFEPVEQPDGEKGFLFKGDSYQRVASAYKDLQQHIDELNQEYVNLVSQSSPTATLLNEESISLKQMEDDYAQWSKQELQTGDVVSIYNPDNMIYNNQFVGQSFVQDQMKAQQIHRLWLEANGPSDETIQLDIAEIHKIETTSTDLIDISALPYYRADLRFAKYASQQYDYTVYSNVHKIIEIFPIMMPQTEFLTPHAPLTIETLEQKARALIATLSPETDLNLLNAAPGKKIGSFFFRWEDHSKPFLDDHRTYPFVQVGYNSNGELLNYYNTLPLSH